jgi:hypothetical protein
MDKHQIIAIFALAIAVLSIFTAILYQPVQISDDSEIYTVFFGLTDTLGGSIDENLARNTVNDLCLSYGLGFTSYIAYGGYVSNGTLITNDTLVYMFALTDEETVLSLVNEAKTNLNIDTIMFETSNGTISFV